MTATIAPPETQQDWANYMNEFKTPKAFMDAFNDGSFQENVNHFVTAKTKEADDIKAQVTEQVQLALKDMYEAGAANPDRPPVNLGGDGRPRATRPDLAVSNPSAAGAALNGVCDSLWDYMHVIHHNAHLNAEDLAKRDRIRAYQEKIPAEGGDLVPEEFRTELLMMQLEASVVRPLANVIPMSSATLRFPKVDETSRVSSVYGGIVVYRTEEGADLVESTAAFSSVKLEATKQTALCHVTNELISDYPAIAAFITQTYPQAMGFYEDIDFISGTGAGEPLGGLSAGNGALIVVAGEGGQTAATIVWENVLAMYTRMLPSSLGRAVWLASPDVFVQLATMALQVGTGGSAVWLIDAHGAPVLTLLGRPVIMTEKTPGKLGAQSDLSFVDWGMYLVGDRQLTTMASSPHVKFVSDKTTYRVIARNDGRPWLDSAITPHNNSATLSPFVTLATRT